MINILEAEFWENGISPDELGAAAEVSAECLSCSFPTTCTVFEQRIKICFVLLSTANSTPEEGEVSSSDGESSEVSSDAFDEEELRKQFDDGYDDELVGDEDDRRALENMTEKEREQELYNRSE